MKIVGIISLAVLGVGTILYMTVKGKTPTTTTNDKPIAGNQLSKEVLADVLVIAGSTGIDKELIKVGDSDFIIAWYKGLSLGNDTFSYKGQNFNTNNGQLFS